MFICLSSGARPRYRQDIMRALAMPKGSRLQFRYDLNLLSAKVRDSLSKGNEKDTPTLIAYIDQYDNSKITELVPCRFATMIEAVPHGTTISLTLILEEFGYSENLTAFNHEMTSASADTLPRWGSDKVIRGAYWLEISQDLTSVIRSNELGTWEKIVTQLMERSDFNNQPYFYMIKGLYPAAHPTAIPYKADGYELKPGRQYELQIYHFYPGKQTTQSWLRLNVSERLKLITNGCLSIDSRYDMKRVYFKTDRPSRKDNAVLSVYRVDSELPDGSPTWEFDLLCKVKGTFWQNLLYGIGLGVLLAAPHCTAAILNPNLSSTNKCLICAVSLLSGIFAGIFAAFALKRSV